MSERSLDNKALREYIKLLDSTGVSKEILERFFKMVYDIDVKTFNEQYNLCVRIREDNIKRKLETENKNDIDDINDIAKDEEKRDNFAIKKETDEIWK